MPWSFRLAAPKTASEIRFSEYTLDLRTSELRRDGAVVRLQPQPAKILAILASRAGEVVTRQELADQVWGSETYVDFEHGLNYAIQQIRSVLDDDPKEPRFVETVPKRGYRFVATVSDGDPSFVATLPEGAVVTSAKRTGLWRRVLLLCLVLLSAVVGWFTVASRRRPASPAVPPAIHSLAVLPFHNLSSDPQQDYFTDGTTDELITNLAKLGAFKVISHTSVERFKHTDLPLPEIARQLGVDAVIEGSVTQSQGRVRITAQLIDARTDQHLWAESYERDLHDVLALQDEVARQIAIQIGFNLNSSSSVQQPPRKVDSAAHEAYLKGLFYWSRSNCEGSRKSLPYFQEATAKDPAFAPAYVGLAQSYFTLGDWGCSPIQDVFPKSKAAAVKALQVDPQIGAAHAWLGALAYFYEWDWDRADDEFRSAIRLDPNYAPAHVLYATLLVSLGKSQQGLDELKRAQELDPTSEITNMASVHVLYLARQYPAAIDQAKKALEVYPNSGGTYYWLAAAYEQSRLYQQACEAYQESNLLPGNGSQFQCNAHDARGYWRKALSALQTSDVCGRLIFAAHAGDSEQTLKSLAPAYDHRCTNLRMLRADAIYDPFRHDPRFQSILTKLHFQDVSSSPL